MDSEIVESLEKKYLMVAAANVAISLYFFAMKHCSGINFS